MVKLIGLHFASYSRNPQIRVTLPTTKVIFMMLQILLLIASLVLVFAVAFTNAKKKGTKQLPLPPGPIRWPIIGSIPQMMMERSPYPHLQLLGLAKKYGGIMSIGFGVHYAVVVSNYEIIKEALKRTETNHGRYRFDFLERLYNYQNTGILLAYGDTWKEQRKKVIKLLRQFGFGKKQTMDETMHAEVNDLVRDIKKEIATSGGIWEVDALRLAASAINILWASVGGYRFDPHSAQIKQQLDLSIEILEALGPKNLLSPFPFLKIFPELSGYNRIGELRLKFRKFMMELIEEAKERRQGRVEPHSFVEAYLDEIEENKSNSNMTEEELVVILMDLFLAGSDTSSAALNWTILFLGLYPDVQNKARAEIKQFNQGKDAFIPSAALVSMPYMNAIILEGMRMATFLPSIFPRNVTEDFECGGYRIPKGTCLFPLVYPVFHDESFWGDPEVFRPERLLMVDGSLDPHKVDHVIQFGSGGRACPGENLAMTSIFMSLTGLLRAFSFEVVKGREPQPIPNKPSLTMKPKPFPLRVNVLGKSWK